LAEREAQYASPSPRAQLLKSEADDFAKEHKFDAAVSKYNEALDAVAPRDANSLFALTLRNNRSNSNLQLGNHPDVVKDTTHVLDHDGFSPTTDDRKLRSMHVKALLRRGLALESLEKLPEALRDIEMSLELEISSVAASAQARLRAAVSRHPAS